MKNLLTLSLAIALYSTSSFAAGAVIGKVSTDLDRDGKLDTISLVEAGTEAEPDLLTLVVEYGNGQKIENPTIVRKVGMGDAANVSLKLQANGSVVVTSVRDWGTSNWSTAMYLSFRNGKLKISGLDYDWMYREKGGKCQFNFLAGTESVNGRSAPYSRQDVEFTAQSSTDSYTDTCLQQTDGN